MKNIVGAFYQPKAVFIDTDTLLTLPKRHFYNGLVEALKAGLIYDEKLFALFEEEDIPAHLEEIIYHALCVKKAVVEADEKELGLRKILNFGHTIGHAIESYYHLSQYLHGECVAMGMLYFMSEDVQKRVLPIYKRMHLQSDVPYDSDEVFEILCKDKKASGDHVTVVKVNTIGKAELKEWKLSDVRHILKG